MMIPLITDYIVIFTFVHEESTIIMSAGDDCCSTDRWNTPMTVDECLMLAIQYLKCQQFLMNAW